MAHEPARSHDDDGFAAPERRKSAGSAEGTSGSGRPADDLVWPPADTDLDDLEVIEIGQAPSEPAPSPPPTPAFDPAPRDGASTPILLPLTTLRAPEVALQWHEAVAIVAELAASLAHVGPAARMPDAAQLFLSGEGTIVEALVGGAGEAPVPGLGGLLDSLTAGLLVPDELRAVIDASRADPPAYRSATELAGALAFFERPGRRAILASLASRASEVAAGGALHEELERLKAKAREAAARAAETRREEPASAWWQTPVAVRLVLVAAGVGSMVAVVVLAVLFWPATAPDGTPATLADRAQTRVARLVEAGRQALAPDPPPALVPVVPDDAAPAAAPAERGSARVRRGATAPAGAVGIDGLGGDVATRPPGGERWAIALEPASDPAVWPPDSRVYTAADVDVEPPALVRQQLPSEPPPGLTLGDVGVLELLVNENGEVENVRLVAREGRFQERMILAAAKAWRFTPAMKDGRPVKYRTRVRITL